MTTSFGHPTPPGPAGVQDEYYRMSMAASQDFQTISKENQALTAQQGEIFAGLIKGMDKASTRAALPKILYGAKAISSKRAFMTTASRYTYRELTTHLRTKQARARASAAAKKTAALFARQETKLLSEIRSGAYTGTGSAQSLGAIAAWMTHQTCREWRTIARNCYAGSISTGTTRSTLWKRLKTRRVSATSAPALG
jgi:hypothetical protein